MNAIPLNGPRTLVSRCAGSLTFGDNGIPPLPVFVPAVPIGMVAVPLRPILRLLTGEDVPEDLLRSTKQALKEAGITSEALQVLLTEELGCIDTVSAAVALGLIEAGWSKEAADQFAPFLERLAAASLSTDGTGGSIARFESLTRLHRIAGKPKGKAPGHWYHRRGREEAGAFGGKGAWRTESGEWMASHQLAASYAQWLFPAFLIWTMDLIFDDPVSRQRMEGMFQRIFGASFVTVDAVDTTEEAEALPHLRLVHNQPALEGDEHADQP